MKTTTIVGPEPYLGTCLVCGDHLDKQFEPPPLFADFAKRILQWERLHRHKETLV